MSVFNVGYPKEKDGYYLFENIVLDRMDLNDCNDTVGGVCYDSKNLSECMKICTDSKDECDGGYYISSPVKNHCVPLRSYNEGGTYPYYRFRKKSFYPELKDSEVTFFLKDKYPYPPYIANLMFFQDQFILQNIESGLYIGYQDTDDVTVNVSFSKEPSTNLQFLPIEILRSFVEKYVMIYNGDSVAVNVPHTAFILRKGIQKSSIEWLMRAVSYRVSTNIFTIHVHDMKIGEPISYDKIVYFKYFDRIIHYNPDSKELEVSSKGDYDSAKQAELYFTFKIIPKVQVYYCKDEKCLSESLENCETSGKNAYKNGIPVDRNPECWGICGKEIKSSIVLSGKEKRKKVNILFFLILGIVILLIFYFLTKKRKRGKK